MQPLRHSACRFHTGADVVRLVRATTAPNCERGSGAHNAGGCARAEGRDACGQ